MEKLKPCPFCGGEAKEFPSSGAPIWCSNSHCGLNNGVMDVEMWNTRPAGEVEIDQNRIFNVLRQHCNDYGIGALDIHLHGLANAITSKVGEFIRFKDNQ